MRLVAYIRVSRRDEDPKNQEYAILKYATARGYQVIDTIVDVESGATLERKGVKQVLQMLDSEEIDGIIVYSLDRLARSLWDLSQVVKVIESRGKALISIREEWLNTIDPNVRKLIIAILGWAGEMERKFTSERTKLALERLRAQGKRLGRPTKLTPEVRLKLLKLLEKGLSLKDISRILGVGYSTVRKYVREDRGLREAYVRARYKL